MKKILIILILCILGIFVFRIVHKFTAKPPLSITQIQEKEGIPVEVIEIKPDTLFKFVNVTGFVGSEEDVCKLEEFIQDGNA